jgi:hypothetical protein
VSENLKLLIVLGVLAVIFLLLYLRLRPFIKMARQMFGVAREVRRAVNPDAANFSKQRSATDGDRLVRCAACETWVPTSRAVRLRSSNASYCSHACLESAAEISRRKATG